MDSVTGAVPVVVVRRERRSKPRRLSLQLNHVLTCKGHEQSILLLVNRNRWPASSNTSLQKKKRQPVSSNCANTQFLFMQRGEIVGMCSNAHRCSKTCKRHCLQKRDGEEAWREGGSACSSYAQENGVREKQIGALSLPPCFRTAIED